MEKKEHWCCTHFKEKKTRVSQIQHLIFLQKSSIVDVRLGSKYASGNTQRQGLDSLWDNLLIFPFLNTNIWVSNVNNRKRSHVLSAISTLFLSGNTVCSNLAPMNSTRGNQNGTPENCMGTFLMWVQLSQKLRGYVTDLGTTTPKNYMGTLLMLVQLLPKTAWVSYWCGYNYPSDYNSTDSNRKPYQTKTMKLYTIPLL